MVEYGEMVGHQGFVCLNRFCTSSLLLISACLAPLSSTISSLETTSRQLFVYADSKGLLELRNAVIPFWESLEKPQFILSKEPNAVDASDRRWIARRLATLGVVGINGLTSLGSLGLKRLGTNEGWV